MEKKKTVNNVELLHAGHFVGSHLIPFHNKCKSNSGRQEALKNLRQMEEGAITVPGNLRLSDISLMLSATERTNLELMMWSSIGQSLFDENRDKSIYLQAGDYLAKCSYYHYLVQSVSTRWVKPGNPPNKSQQKRNITRICYNRAACDVCILQGINLAQRLGGGAVLQKLESIAEKNLCTIVIENPFFMENSDLQEIHNGFEALARKLQN